MHEPTRSAEGRGPQVLSSAMTMPSEAEHHGDRRQLQGQPDALEQDGEVVEHVAELEVVAH
jgi:hypothetical protein